MSSTSLVVRRAAGLGVAAAVLIGLHAAAEVQDSPPTPVAALASGESAIPHIGVVVCATEWCAPLPTPTPTNSSSAVSSSPTLTFDPTHADVYPSEGFAFVLDNRTTVAVEVTDQNGTVVAKIGVEGSASLRAPGAGTYRYTLTSPRSESPPVLTIVAHDQG